MTNSSTTTATTTLPLAPGRWTLDAAHSTVGFAIRHLGISKVRGVFHGVDVDVEVGETLQTTSVSATIDLATVDTGNTDRDAHVRAPDLLDVATRPTMRFTSTGIVETDGGWRLDGDLAIGEVTRPVSLALEFGGLEVYPIDGSTHAGFEATGAIDRHDFGIDFGMLDAALGRKVQVALDVQLQEPGPAGDRPA